MAKKRSHGEGTIYHSKTLDRWVAQISLPDGKRKTKYGKTRGEVRTWLIDMRKRVADGMLSDDQNYTFGGFLDRWFEDIKKPLLKPSTISTHESVVTHCVYIKSTAMNIVRIKSIDYRAHRGRLSVISNRSPETGGPGCG